MSGSKKGSAAGRVVGRILLVILIIAAAAGIAALAAVLRLKANFTELKRVDGTGSLYSAVYHNSEPGVDIWVYPDYSRSYHFSVDE